MARVPVFIARCEAERAIQEVVEDPSLKSLLLQRLSNLRCRCAVCCPKQEIDDADPWE